jgi:hypothetical protein
MTRAGVLLMAGVVLGVGAVAPAQAADAKHSGRVIAVDPAGKLRLEEATASPGPEPRTVQRTLRLGPETSLRRVARVAVDLAGWPNAWREERTTIQALRPGDYVTVTTGEGSNTVLVLEVVHPEG